MDGIEALEAGINLIDFLKSICGIIENFFSQAVSGQNMPHIPKRF